MRLCREDFEVKISFCKRKRSAILDAIDDFLEQGELILNEKTHFTKFCEDEGKHLAIVFSKLNEISKCDRKKLIALQPKYLHMLAFYYRKKPQKSSESGQKLNYSGSSG